MMPQLDRTFGRDPGGLALLKTLLGNVRMALVHGINLIFVSSAAIMAVAVVLNLFLRSIPLRHGAPKAEVHPEV
jgi:hypothetical protein